MFIYDYSFWSFDRNGDFIDQQILYERLAQPLLDRSFEGYNTCLFAYGQTGSGKSYSIMGEDEAVGVIPRFSEELFERIESLTDSEVSALLPVEFSMNLNCINRLCIN
jgi:kinesin family protein 14